MKNFLPLVALLAFVGCAEEPAEVETAPVVEETVEPMIDEPMMDEPMMDSTMTEEGEMVDDTTAVM